MWRLPALCMAAGAWGKREPQWSDGGPAGFRSVTPGFAGAGFAGAGYGGRASPAGICRLSGIEEMLTDLCRVPKEVKSMDAQKKVNILLVDDNPDKLLGIENILSSLGQNLVKAQSGREALRALLTYEFAVVLMDVRMPGMDGFETAALMRQREKSVYLPIIFITSADRSETHLARGYSLGAVDYIYAPIVPDILRAKVEVFVELKLQRERMRLLEQREHERQLSAVTEKLEEEVKRNRFFSLSLDLLCIAGIDGFFRQLNPSWERTLGFSDQELKARPFLEFVHPEDREATLREMEKLQAGELVIDFENRYLTKDGSWRWLVWNCAPHTEAQLIYAVAHDITGRKRADAALAEKKVLLEVVNQEMGAFNYSVAHDLRAPLRSIHGFSQALVEDFADQLPPKAQDYLNRVCAAAGRMGDLIDALLHLGQFGRAELIRRPVDLSNLARAVGGELAANHPALQVEFHVEDGLAAQADAKLMRVVLENLLGNAWKFTARKPDARVEFGVLHKAPGRAYFVRDNGAGFDMAYASRLFTPFQRLHPESEFSGTGIGLATVQRVVARHGGRVWVEAAVGQGATVYFTLDAGTNEGPK
ncbi:MAG: response regulator [Acidobacteriia bacterium]|nr:response regulator [Terriglobia bacterium]